MFVYENISVVCLYNLMFCEIFPNCKLVFRKLTHQNTRLISIVSKFLRMNSDDILKDLRMIFPSVPYSLLQEKALEMVFNPDITEQQVIEDIKREARRLNKKISVTSFDQTVNLAKCDPTVAEKITITLQLFRKIKGWVCNSETVTNPDSLIETIKIIDNEAIMEDYQEQKEEFANNCKSTKEIFLFHGTSEMNLKEIIKENFDLNACPRENATGEPPRKKLSVFGKGIYFSEHPGYTTLYGNALILCKVLLGNNLIIKKETCKSHPDFPEIFDSKKINSSSLEGQIYVVRRNSQILPFSIVTFQDKNIRGKILQPQSPPPLPPPPIKTVEVKLSPEVMKLLKTRKQERFVRDILFSPRLNNSEKENLVRSHLKI